uniref:Uncharacterized protein n=1 Tax=Nannospalax galili TaxID=1026970 RepID=A0A8C6W1H9_NANGA
MRSGAGTGTVGHPHPSISHWNPGSGAAATLRPSAPLPVRTRPPLDPCPSSLQALGPRALDSLGSDQAQEHSALDHLTRLSRALVAGEAEPVSVFLSAPVTHCMRPSPADEVTDGQVNFLRETSTQKETTETRTRGTPGCSFHLFCFVSGFPCY